MTVTTPDWAIQRALEVADYNSSVQAVVDRQTMFWDPIKRFAAYIAAHEEAPVDPLLVEAREMAAEACEKIESRVYASEVRAGKHDDAERSGVPIALRALRRGMELATPAEASN